MIYTISIGSNTCREENMEMARRRLTELFPGIRFSKEEETAPLFFHRSDWFSNQVARFAYDGCVEDVLTCLKAIEHEAGRTPQDKAQEIVRLDIDLLTCDSVVYKPEDLKRDYILRGLQQL